MQGMRDVDVLAKAASVGLARVDGERDARAFLDEAAQACAAALAGAGTRRAQPIEVADTGDDSRAVTGEEATRILADIVALRDPLLAEEWANLAAARGSRIHPAMLPPVLDWCESDVRVRECFDGVLSERGFWLARRRDSWRQCVPTLLAEDARRVWGEAKGTIRLAALRALRRSKPEAARELAESVWAEASAEDRAATLAVMRDRLTMDDEPWLETCLDDRSKPVRQQAAELLAILPESRLAQRMRERAAMYLRVAPGANERWSRGARKDTITLDRSSSCDRAMRRDGLVDSASSVSVRHWLSLTHVDAPSRWRHSDLWLALQVLAAAPPGPVRDGQTTSLDPRDVILAVMAEEWGQDVLIAWEASAVRHRHEAWAVAMIESWCLPSATLDPIEGLYSVLSIEQRERLGPEIISSVKKGGLRELAAAFVIDPRSECLSSECLNVIERGPARRGMNLDWLVYGVNPALVHRALDQVRRLSGVVEGAERLMRILRLRSRMAEAFVQPARGGEGSP